MFREKGNPGWRKGSLKRTKPTPPENSQKFLSETLSDDKMTKRKGDCAANIKKKKEETNRETIPQVSGRETQNLHRKRGRLVQFINAYTPKPP